MAEMALRQSDPEPKSYRFCGHAFGPAHGVLQHPRGAKVGSQLKAADLLRHVACQAGRLVFREDLGQAVWSGTIVTDDSTPHCLFGICRALGEQWADLVRILQKRGYLLAAENTYSDTTASPAASAFRNASAASSLHSSSRIGDIFDGGGNIAACLKRLAVLTSIHLSWAAYKQVRV